MLAKKNPYASEFAVEWSALFLLYLVDIAWARAIDFHLVLSLQNWAFIAGFLSCAFALRVLFPQRVGPFVEYFSLSLVGSAGLIVFSYLCMASATHPLVDQALLQADRALGFDWLALHNWVMAHPALAGVGSILYATQVLQGFYCTIFLGLQWERRRMQELWRLTFIASILCCVTGMLFPALGPFKIFNLPAEGTFLPVMEHLLSHRDLVFTPASLAGVICFTSLHTAMALTIPYGLRRTGPIFRIFLVLNVLLLFTIPVFGGHFLVDMIGGAVVMLVSLGLARLWLAGPAILRDPQLVENPA